MLILTSAKINIIAINQSSDLSNLSEFKSNVEKLIKLDQITHVMAVFWVGAIIIQWSPPFFALFKWTANSLYRFYCSKEYYNSKIG